MVRGEPILVRANQIILWVTLAHQRFRFPNPYAIPFPVILDTGHTHSFALHERHLVEWAGLQPEMLDISGEVRDRGRRLFLRTANIWIHLNQSRDQNLLERHSPNLVEARRGIAVYPGRTPSTAHSRFACDRRERAHSEN